MGCLLKNVYLVSLFFATAMPVATASTSLIVEPEDCVREAERSVVVCSFRIGTGIGRSASITGGQYSRGTDADGNAYEASSIRSHGNSGLAISLDLESGEWNVVNVVFDNVNTDIKEFDTMVLRFDDGYWEGGRIPILAAGDAEFHGCRR